MVRVVRIYQEGGGVHGYIYTLPSSPILYFLYFPTITKKRAIGGLDISRIAAKRKDLAKMGLILAQ